MKRWPRPQPAPEPFLPDHRALPPDAAHVKLSKSEDFVACKAKPEANTLRRLGPP